MLVSERLRLRAMLGLFMVISLNISVALLVFPEVVATFFEGSLDPFVVLPITYSYLLYAIAAYVSLTKSLSKNAAPNKLWGYTGALVESSIPTLLTYALGTIQAPSTSLFLPPLFLYFVFIALSALRLDQKLVWFAGICCSMQYLALSYYSTDGFRVSAELPQILTAPQHHVAKSIVLLLTTLAIALVVTELRKRLLNSSYRLSNNRKYSTFLVSTYHHKWLLDSLPTRMREQADLNPPQYCFLTFGGLLHSLRNVSQRPL